MTKDDALQQLRAAKTAHLQWRAYAQALISGVPLDEQKVPVIHTDCKFGNWYYSSGQDLSGLKRFRDIEKPHEDLHAVYMEIFKTLYGEDTRSGLSKLFGSKQSYKQSQMDKAKVLLDDMINVSNKLVGLIDNLNLEVKSMDDDKFAALIA